MASDPRASAWFNRRARMREKEGGELDNAVSTAQIVHYLDRGYGFPVPALTPVEAAGYRQTIEDFERRSGLVAGHVIRNKGHLKVTRIHEGPGTYARHGSGNVAFVDRRYGGTPLGAAMVHAG